MDNGLDGTGGGRRGERSGGSEAEEIAGGGEEDLTKVFFVSRDFRRSAKDVELVVAFSAVSFSVIGVGAVGGSPSIFTSSFGISSMVAEIVFALDAGRVGGEGGRSARPLPFANRGLFYACKVNN